jgi:hypothetical protein
VPLGDYSLASGALMTRVSTLQISTAAGPIDCWMYASAGLLRAGQREVVFILRRMPGESETEPPYDLLVFIEQLLSFANAGQIVDEYACTVFGGRGPLGFGSIVYAPLAGYGHSPELPDLVSPGEPLAAILLTTEEGTVASNASATRILARLGQAGSVYPYPIWSDRARRPVAEESEPSILHKGLPLAQPRGATASQHENYVTLRLHMDSQRGLSTAVAGLPETQPFGIGTVFDGVAQAHLVWMPGQKQPNAITASAGPDRDYGPEDGDMVIAGSFVALVQSRNDSPVQMIEDGFGVYLNNNEWAELRHAFVDGARFELAPSQNSPGFRLLWLD